MRQLSVATQELCSGCWARPWKGYRPGTGARSSLGTSSPTGACANARAVSGAITIARTCRWQISSASTRRRGRGFVATALSGGEPFLRSDLGEVVRFIKQEAGMSILLFNTGWYLKQRMDEVLPHIDMMIVSLDSARAERHDAIRGLPGLFDRAIEGVRLVKDKYPDVSLQFNCCVQKGSPMRSTTCSAWRRASMCRSRST